MENLKKLINNSIKPIFENEEAYRRLSQELIKDTDYIVYHAKVVEGGKIEHVTIQSEVSEVEAQEIVNKLETDYPDEVFYYDKKMAINSKFNFNQ
jgi:hypothetical protein